MTENKIAENLSIRLYEILLKNSVECDDSEAEAEIDDEYPLECWHCSELFFDSEIFAKHISEHKQKLRKQHKCSFKDCRKSFKKSSELRKHEVKLTSLKADNQRS